MLHRTTPWLLHQYKWLTLKVLNFWKFTSYCSLKTLMVGHGGSSAGSYLADPTSPIPSHCASIVATSTVRVNTIHEQSDPRNIMVIHDVFTQYITQLICYIMWFIHYTVLSIHYIMWIIYLSCYILYHVIMWLIRVHVDTFYHTFPKL